MHTVVRRDIASKTPQTAQHKNRSRAAAAATASSAQHLRRHGEPRACARERTRARANTFHCRARCPPAHDNPKLIFDTICGQTDWGLAAAAVTKRSGVRGSQSRQCCVSPWITIIAVRWVRVRMCVPCVRIVRAPSRRRRERVRDALPNVLTRARARALERETVHIDLMKCEHGVGGGRGGGGGEQCKR